MSRTLRRRRTRSVVLAGLVATAGLTAAVPVAGAASDGWSCNLTSGNYCSYARHSLVSVSNYSAAGRTAGSAASTTSGTGGLYGSWAWGNGYSCHSYSGNNLLYPLIKNGSSVSGTFSGGSTYGSGADSC
jgi:hypothetical protein